MTTLHLADSRRVPGSRRILLVGVVVPTALVLAAALRTVALTGGPPAISSGAGASWTAVLGPPLLTLALGAWMSHAAIELTRGHGTLGQVRWRAAWGPWAAAMSLVATYPDLWRQADPAGHPSHWSALAPGVVAAGVALGGVLAIPRGAVRGPVTDAPVPRLLQLTASQRALWMASTRSTPLLWATVIVLAAWTVTSAPTATTLVQIAVGAAVAVVLLGPWRVLIDSRGFQAHPLTVRPRLRYPLDRISHADVLAVRPWADFGGWGVRVGVRRRFGVITAGGPALAVTLRSGWTFVITVADPETAAALINGLKHRQAEAHDVPHAPRHGTRRGTRTPMTDPDVALAATDLSKDFGPRSVVSGLSMEVPPGRAFGLLGPNGSGKTTTVRLLTGLLTPTAGSVSLFGQPLTRSTADALRTRVGVQTDTNLYESLSARENLRIWGELYGLPTREATRRAAEVLEVLGLTDRAESLVGELSKGMRQKLSVGRAVLHEPDLLFLDEPTAGLDPEASVDLIDYVKQMIRTLRTTVVICTHQLHGLEELCDDVGILRDGRLIASGEVRSLLRRRWPEHRYEVTVAGDVPRARAVVAASTGRPVEVSSADSRLTFAVAREEAVSAAVAALVEHRIPVRAVSPREPTLQELYFATITDGSLA